MLCANENLPRKGQVRTDPTMRWSVTHTPTSIHTEHGFGLTSMLVPFLSARTPPPAVAAAPFGGCRSLCASPTTQGTLPHPWAPQPSAAPVAAPVVVVQRATAA